LAYTTDEGALGLGLPVTYDTLWIWSAKFWGLKVCRCRLGWNRSDIRLCKEFRQFL